MYPPQLHAPTLSLNHSARVKKTTAGGTFGVGCPTKGVEATSSEFLLEGSLTNSELERLIKLCSPIEKINAETMSLQYPLSLVEVFKMDNRSFLRIER